MKTNITQKVLTATLAATLTFTTLAIPASAVWNTTDTGKQWVETDGTVAKSKWLTMKSGDRYYIKSNGIAATGLLTLTETVNGKKTKSIYYFAKDGKMQTGWQYVNKNYYYFNTKTGKAYTGTKTIGDYKFKFDSKGIWNGKVYNSKGKDVTSNTDIEKIIGITTKTTTTSKNPETVVIAGQEYKTDIKEILINKEGVTDEDLVNLKYLTKLTHLSIVPGAVYTGSDSMFYNITDVTCTGTTLGGWDKKKTLYNYEFTATVRKTENLITNIDFCKYMPKLERIEVAFATKLTDITGLSSATKLQNVMFFNCTALKDVKALTTDNFQKNGANLNVWFTDDVIYAFTDMHFGKRIKVFAATMVLNPAQTRYTYATSEKIVDGDTDAYAKKLLLWEYAPNTTAKSKAIWYTNGKLSSSSNWT